MADTSIEWTEKVWNPTLGCERVSTGCGAADRGGCYAERLAFRLAAMGQRDYMGLTHRLPDGKVRWTGKVICLPERHSHAWQLRRVPLSAGQAPGCLLVVFAICGVATWPGRGLPARAPWWMGPAVQSARLHCRKAQCLRPLSNAVSPASTASPLQRALSHRYTPEDAEAPVR